LLLFLCGKISERCSTYYTTDERILCAACAWCVVKPDLMTNLAVIFRGRITLYFPGVLLSSPTSSSSPATTRKKSTTSKNKKNNKEQEEEEEEYQEQQHDTASHVYC
jgi:hypothetical protein